MKTNINKLKNYKNSQNNTEFFKHKDDIANKILKILETETEAYWLATELKLAKEFWLPQEKIRKLEEDYQEPLNMAKVMNDAEDYFETAKEKRKIQYDTRLNWAEKFWQGLNLKAA